MVLALAGQCITTGFCGYAESRYFGLTNCRYVYSVVSPGKGSVAAQQYEMRRRSRKLLFLRFHHNLLAPDSIRSSPSGADLPVSGAQDVWHGNLFLISIV